MNMYIYSFLFILFSLFIFFLSLHFYYMEIEFLFFWEMLSINSVCMDFVVNLKFDSLLFMSVVLFISSSIMSYSYMYMSTENEIDKFRFLILLILFIFSMMILLMCPSILSVLLGWDWLGLISFMLVIYYQNFLSLNSGIVTFLCNRLGDSFLLMVISMSIGMGKGFMMMSVLEFNDYLSMFFLFLASLTKSAQMPFSSWLPMAMSAPTPISSLVHSSTLVTAGVYLMIQYIELLMINELNFYLLTISILTMVMAGINALFENDFKKIIALSTLSQLGFMMSILSLGFKFVALFHLLIHALFKSMLFMCAGIFIHSNLNNQDIRFYGKMFNFLPLTSMFMIVSVFSMCGLPFLSGFFSKDLIVEIYYSSSSMLMNFSLLMLIFGIILTVAYNFRMIFMLFFKNVNMNSNKLINEDFKIVFPMVNLLIFSIIFGKEFNLMFFFFLEDPNLISLILKFLIWFLLVLGIFISLMIYKRFIFLKSKITYFFLWMWMLDKIYSELGKFIMFFSNNFYLMYDKWWFEGFQSKIYLKILVLNFYLIKIKSIYLFMNYFLFLLILFLFV